MNKNILFIALIVILVAIIGVAAYMMLTPTAGPAQLTEAGTKIALHNNGSTWVHTAGVFENTTLKNGTVSNVYFNAWTKPKDGKVVIDLSNAMGYGNESLPANTTMRLKLYLDPVSENPSGSAVVTKTIEGWSNTPEPSENVTGTLLTFPTHVVLQLPANITDNNLVVTTDSAKGVAFISSVNTLYVECLVTVNSDKSVTITILQQPELCNLVAGG